MLLNIKYQLIIRADTKYELHMKRVENKWIL